MLLKLPLSSSCSRWLPGLCELRSRISIPQKVAEIQIGGVTTGVPVPFQCRAFQSLHIQSGSYRRLGTHQIQPTVSPTPIHLQFSATRTYGRHTTTSGLNETLNPTEAAKRKAAGKSVEAEKILLMSETENISVTTLVDAEKLARKKGFQLVEVKEMESRLHSDKKVYKLQSQAQHFGEDWKNRHESSGDDKKEKKKEDKTVLFKSKISLHDLEAKVKQMNKLLEKGHTIRVFIGGTGSTGDPEFVFRGIQNNLTRAAKIQQKKTSPTDIRFQILPIAVEPEGEAAAAAAMSPSPKAKAPKIKEKQDPSLDSSDVLT